jgi:hypothetical protein
VVLIHQLLPPLALTRRVLLQLLISLRGLCLCGCGWYFHLLYGRAELPSADGLSLCIHFI